MGRLVGKVAIVTGGAMGIGRATSELFVREGAKVVLADIDDVAGNAAIEEIRASSGEATFMHLDVTNEGDWKRLIADTVREHGKLNVLVNNAGVTLARGIADTTLEEFERVMRVNATGVFLGMKSAIQAMKSCGELCSIINRSSIDGQIGEVGMIAYDASKGAVTLMTKCAALEMAEARYSIRVNSVHPGYVHTKMGEKEAAEFGLSVDEYFAQACARHPIGFLGEPIDIAYMDLYLASDESRWVTGAEFTADGGYTAQ